MKEFTNFFYKPNPQVLYPDSSLRAMKLWEEYFLAYVKPNQKTALQEIEERVKEMIAEKEAKLKQHE
jgi:hypothetical protein